MYVEVLCVDVAVFGEVEILLCDEDAFFENPFVDLLAVGFGDEPLREIVSWWKGRTCAADLHGGEFLLALRGIAYYHDLEKVFFGEGFCV